MYDPDDLEDASTLVNGFGWGNDDELAELIYSLRVGAAEEDASELAKRRDRALGSLLRIAGEAVRQPDLFDDAAF